MRAGDLVDGKSNKLNAELISRWSILEGSLLPPTVGPKSTQSSVSLYMPVFSFHSSVSDFSGLNYSCARLYGSVGEKSLL